ncbi:MAG: hypothetical protein LBP72_06960 [Dysgonamonadaceae bacterium]|nr:hypothetical protein [Dysgonamonadaceae bacterium]
MVWRHDRCCLFEKNFLRARVLILCVCVCVCVCTHNSVSFQTLEVNNV